MKLLDAKEAGRLLGITDRRVRALCEAGCLGRLLGRQWVITVEELRRFKLKPRPPGRPPGRKTKFKKH